LLNGRVVLIESACNTVECHYLIMHHVKRFNSKVYCRLDEDFVFHTFLTQGSERVNSGSRMICTITHRRPLFDTTGVYCRAFTVTNRQREIGDFRRTTDPNTLYLDIRLGLADIQNTQRCRQLPNDQRYFNIECQMLVVYYNMLQESIVKRFYFRLTVRIPREERFELLISAREIIEHGCDCIIDETLTFQRKIYRGEECRNEISPGALLTYGEYLCFGIFGDDDLSKSSEYEIGSLFALYKKADGDSETIDILGVAIIKCSFEDICVKGQVYIIVPMIYVGEMDFNTVVVLRDLKRMLTDEGEGAQPRGERVSIGEFKVIHGSFSSSVAVVLTTFIAFLLLVL